MNLPSQFEYPIIAIADLDGMRDEFERLIGRLHSLDEWSPCAMVLLGDFVDRGADVPGAIVLVLLNARDAMPLTRAPEFPTQRPRTTAACSCAALSTQHFLQRLM